MMKQLLFGLLLLACFAAPARAAGLQLSIQNGKVTLDAQEVTVRQILTEWARVGKTRIVNLERLGGGPITIKFEALSEKQALDIILRAVPGYVAAPREVLVANASVYETILVMPTTTAVATARAPGPVFGGAPGSAANITQLRQPPPVPTGAAADNTPDPQDDPAIAAAAAAGLVPIAAPEPGVSPVSTPLTMPGPPQAAPRTATPSNPWNAPAGTAQPSLAPPPAPVATPPVMRPRPPQADR